MHVLAATHPSARPLVQTQHTPGAFKSPKAVAIRSSGEDPSAMPRDLQVSQSLHPSASSPAACLLQGSTPAVRPLHVTITLSNALTCGSCLTPFRRLPRVFSLQLLQTFSRYSCPPQRFSSTTPTNQSPCLLSMTSNDGQSPASVAPTARARRRRSLLLVPPCQPHDRIISFLSRSSQLLRATSSRRLCAAFPPGLADPLAPPRPSADHDVMDPSPALPSRPNHQLLLESFRSTNAPPSSARLWLLCHGWCRYTRTGPCPAWCAAGNVCTLQLSGTRHRSLASLRRAMKDSGESGTLSQPSMCSTLSQGANPRK